VTIGSGDTAVSALPAAVLGAAGHAELAAQGPVAVALPRSRAAQLHIRYGPVSVDDGDALATIRALASPWACRDDFRPDPAGVAVTTVADGGVVDERGLPALATELSELAGFGRATALVPVDAGDAGPAVVAGDLLRTALRARGPLVATGPARMPLPAGLFAAWSVRAWDGVEHVVLVPEPAAASGPVRVVPACVVGQAFAPARCGCRRDLDDALADAAATGSGSVVVLQAPRRALASGPCGGAPEDPAVPLLVDLAVAAVARAGRARTA
jgi:3,4-dihydroxy 2-butanone 4-phosphate synthase/GTP cyclohydrolase II